jgi:hypothetical protein
MCILHIFSSTIELIGFKLRIYALLYQNISWNILFSGAAKLLSCSHYPVLILIFFIAIIIS